jgi:hypothetical protein
MSAAGVNYRSPALVVAHPGHELQVFGWACQTKPRVYILTDGSGTSGMPRIGSSADLLETTGAVRGELFGMFSDRALYRPLVEQRVSFFLDLLDRLASAFIANRIDFVAGDSMDGGDPIHDLCRALTNAAIIKAERVTGMPVANFEFALDEGRYGATVAAEETSEDLRFTLDEKVFGAKLAAAESFVGLEDEVREAYRAFGQDHFRTERLERVRGQFPTPASGVAPAYEAMGERQVAAGAYRSVIRYRDHVLPVMEALRQHAMTPALTG